MSAACDGSSGTGDVGIAVAMPVNTAAVVGWFKLVAALIGMTWMGLDPRLSFVGKPTKAVEMRSDLRASASLSIGASFAGLGTTIASDRHRPIMAAAKAK